MRSQDIVSSRSRAIGPFATAARALLGTALLVVPFMVGESPRWFDILLGSVILPAFFIAGHRALTAVFPSGFVATGPGGHTLNILIGALLISLGPLRDGALFFYGASMLLAAARGYAGCEVLAISNWLFGRRDELGCPVFLPVDVAEREWIERRTP